MPRCFVISAGRWSCESRRSWSPEGEECRRREYDGSVWWWTWIELPGKSRRCLKVALWLMECLAGQGSEMVLAHGRSGLFLGRPVLPLRGDGTECAPSAPCLQRCRFEANVVCRAASRGGGADVVAGDTVFGLEPVWKEGPLEKSRRFSGEGTAASGIDMHSLGPRSTMKQGAGPQRWSECTSGRFSTKTAMLWLRIRVYWCLLMHIRCNNQGSVKFWDLVNRIELRQAWLKWNDSGLSP